MIKSKYQENYANNSLVLRQNVTQEAEDQLHELKSDQNTEY
jgi:hypothetical protein